MFSFILSFIHSFVRSLTLSLIHSFTHSGLCGGLPVPGTVLGTEEVEVQTESLHHEACAVVRVMGVFKARNLGG